MSKYELTDDTVTLADGTVLHRIKALRDFGFVTAGDLGGYIQSEANLSHSGDCWVGDDVWVFGNAWVFDNARVYGNAWVVGNSVVCGGSQISN